MLSYHFITILTLYSIMDPLARPTLREHSTFRFLSRPCLANLSKIPFPKAPPTPLLTNPHRSCNALLYLPTDQPPLCPPSPLGGLQSGVTILTTHSLRSSITNPQVVPRAVTAHVTGQWNSSGAEWQNL